MTNPLGRCRNDTRHGIRVETARADVEIRTRSGFLDAAPRTQVAMALYDVYGGKTYTNTLTKQEEDSKD